MYLGWLISVLVLQPNLLWMAFPPRQIPPAESAKKGGLEQLMEGLEWIGRIACFVIPLFYRVELRTGWQAGALVVMAVSMLLYYAGWARYFLRGRSYGLLFEPFLGIPLLLAISPIVYFLAASVVLGSWPLAAAALILAVGHLYVSQQSVRTLGT